MSYESVDPNSNLALWQNSGIGAYANVGDYAFEFYPAPFDFEAPLDSRAIPPPILSGFGQAPTPTGMPSLTVGPTGGSFSRACPNGYYYVNGKCVPVGTGASAAYGAIMKSSGGPAPTGTPSLTVGPTGGSFSRACPNGYYYVNGKCVPVGTGASAAYRAITGVSGVGDCGCGCGGGCGQGLGQGLFNSGLFTSNDFSQWGWGEWAVLVVGAWGALRILGDIRGAGKTVTSGYRKRQRRRKRIAEASF